MKPRIKSTRGEHLAIRAPTPQILALLDWMGESLTFPAQGLRTGPVRDCPGWSEHVAFWDEKSAWKVRAWCAAHILPGRKFPKGARYSDGAEVYTVVEDGPDHCGQVLSTRPGEGPVYRTPKGWRKVAAS